MKSPMQNVLDRMRTQYPGMTSGDLQTIVITMKYFAEALLEMEESSDEDISQHLTSIVNK